MAFECRLYPAKLVFPEAVPDVALLRGNERAVQVHGETVGVDRLRNHAALRSRLSFGVDAPQLEKIAQCGQLEALYLENVRLVDLHPLKPLAHLRVLSVEGAVRVESLAWLRPLSSLQQLRLEHLPRVHALDEVGRLRQLEALDVSGSMWTRMRVESFEPLRALSGLRYLSLTNILALDGSLRPISGLSRLQTLQFANFYDWSEVAALAGRLPDVECQWFRPFVRVNALPCGSCGGARVMLTGRRQPTVCPTCEPDRVERHAARFERAKQQAAEGDPTGAADTR
jgi:hypothetical protein